MKHTDIAASVFLLAHDPTSGRPLVGRDAVCAGVLAAQLADLMIAGQVVLDDAGRVVVTGRRAVSGGDAAAAVVETLAFRGGGRLGGPWADALGDTVYERVADSLIDTGEIRREPSRRLIGATHDRFPAVDPWRTDRPRQELAHMVRSPRAFDLPGAVAVLAVVATGVGDVVAATGDCAELVAHLPDGLRRLLGGSADRVAPGPGRFAGSRMLVEGAAMQSRGSGRARPSIEALRHRHDVAAGLVTERSPQDAVPVLEQVVADATFWLGPTHADTLAAEGNLAVAYLASGRADVGIPLLVSVLAARERELGTDHPATLTARDVLASVHRTAGRPAEALAHHELVVAGRTRALGPRHPDTLVARLGLGLSRADRGDARAAVVVLGRALRDAMAGCGPTHAVTVAVRGALADSLAATGRTREAAAEFDRAARDAELGLGRAHRDTVALRAARAALERPPPALSVRRSGAGWSGARWSGAG